MYAAYTYIFSVGPNTHKLELFSERDEHNGVRPEHRVKTIELTRYHDVLKEAKEHLTKEQTERLKCHMKWRETAVVHPDGSTTKY